MLFKFCLLLFVALGAPFISKRRKKPSAGKRSTGGHGHQYPTGPVWTLSMQVCRGEDQATLHGLWPDWDHQDCRTEPFDESEIEDLIPTMEKNWPSCFGETDTKFWAHEWNKHGRCSGMDEEEYFQKALDMLAEHGTDCKSQLSMCRICLNKNTFEVSHCPRNRAAQRIRRKGKNSLKK